jgi:hypothetical protein
VVLTVLLVMVVVVVVVVVVVLLLLVLVVVVVVLVVLAVAAVLEVLVLVRVSVFFLFGQVDCNYTGGGTNRVAAPARRYRSLTIMVATSVAGPS